MGKASSSKKVSRVARTGGGRTSRRANISFGYPFIIGLIIVLGVAGIFFSKQNAAAVDHPTIADHWHAAYGFDVCGNFLPDLPQPQNLIGLHTHSDGIIHIEPQGSPDTGKSATLGRFVGGYPGLKLDDTSFTVLNQSFKNGDKCPNSDKTGKVVVKRNGKIIAKDVSKTRVPKNGWITVAFVPEGEDVPAPPDWENKVKKANGGAGEHPQAPTPSTAVTPTVPAAPQSSTPSSAPATSTPGTPTSAP